MNNSLLKPVVMASFFSVLFFTACDKDRYNDVEHTVNGTWTLTKFGKDGNANHALESGETTTAGAAGVDAVISYNDDGTYSVISASFGDVNGLWFQRNDDIYTIAGADTSMQTIISITEKQMVTLNKDTSVAGNWFVFQK